MAASSSSSTGTISTASIPSFYQPGEAKDFPLYFYNNPTQHEKDPKETVSKSEASDRQKVSLCWIRALRFLKDQGYFQRIAKDLPLTIEDLMTMHKQLTSLISLHESGKIRTEFVWWSKKNAPTPTAMTTESLFHCHFFFGSQEDKKSAEEMLAKPPYESVGKSYVKTVDHRTLLREIREGKHQKNGIVRYSYKGRIHTEEDLQPQEANDWTTDRGSDGSSLINRYTWLRELNYYFLPPDQIITRLKEVLEVVNDPKQDVITRASALWYGVIQSHPFLDANKRVGRIASSLLLLVKGGYLPPKLGQQPGDSKKYTTLLLSCFNRKDGLEQFTQFIRGKLIEAYLKNVPTTDPELLGYYPIWS